MNLYIIRHAEAYGQGPSSELTERGKLQAELLGERMKNLNIEKIYCSPYLRTLKTAIPILKGNAQANTEVLHDLMEKGTPPDYSGCDVHTINGFFPEAEIKDIHSLGEETDEDTLIRAKKVIAYIKEDSKNRENIALVAHGTFNNYLISAAADLPMRKNLNFSQDNTGVSLIKYLYENGVERTKIYYTNDIRHIPENVGTEGLKR